MVTSFEFATATRIVFGNGRARELPAIAREFGRRAIIITGSNAARSQSILDSLAKQNIATTLFAIADEPGLENVRAGVALARSNKCEFVISIGGGSVIDAGKAMAALVTNQGSLLDYLEVIGKAQPLTEALLPFIAVPTTAGTGAEVTRNAVLSRESQPAQSADAAARRAR